jgi:hypothetical protein
VDVVEQVALWAGLISSIVSIVLSLVAIVFTIVVDRSARAVTAQTIRSLQKVETEVGRVSTDTRDLIKAGWDRLLVQQGGMSAASSNSAAQEIASGVAAELRADLIHAKGSGGTELTTDRLDALLQRLESYLGAQIATESRTDGPGAAFDQAMRLLQALTPEALAIAIQISDGHITREQYIQLVDGPLGPALVEMRATGLLVVLSGFDAERRRIPVYWYSHASFRGIRAAAQMTEAPPRAVMDRVRAELKRVGYASGSG